MREYKELPADRLQLMSSNTLVINDPVYGFIRIPRGLLCRLISHPLFQRLGRIRQLGMAPFVYPGALHTRKQHSIGAFHLMQTALRTLSEKGHFIFDSEKEAAEAAILLHDIGHGPFSHVLEQVFVKDVGHEQVTDLMLECLNEELNGELLLAINVFRGTHPKPFLHELISSQLDTDRLDYLCRDSFYTGVREGNIGAARLVQMLNLSDERLVVEHKGIYTVENYLMARRLMYWQVYLHKTVLAAEALLKSTLQRAKDLALNGEKIFASPALHHFLYNEVTAADFMDTTSESLKHYAAIDDSDLVCAIKVWQHAPDPILSTLAGSFTNRQLFKVEICPPEDTKDLEEDFCREIAAHFSISPADAHYFVTSQQVRNEMYSSNAEGISMTMPDGSIVDVADISHIVRHDTSDPEETKNYVFHHRL